MPTHHATVFRDRRDAGRQLGERLAQHPPEGDLIVLGLPRGGVPLALLVAEALHAPLDVLVVRKLGAPSHTEWAVGAIATGGSIVFNDDALAMLSLDRADLEPTLARESAELARREATYRAGRPPLDLRGKTAILVDDGLATGATMRAAVAAARHLGARTVLVAAPTASPEAVADLRSVADEVVVLSTPAPYFAVGRWYEDFPQLTDSEVADLLATGR